ncbi:MAG: GatB/YqeY domain-containing protein [Patescibacteria group bacterium]
MSVLLARLEQELKQASRDRAEVKISVLRAVKNTWHNQEIKLKNQQQELGEAEVLKVIRSEAKKRQEARELYLKGGREDLASREQAEYKILEKFLPTVPSATEVKQVVEKLKQELGCTGVQDIGRLTKAVIDHFQGAVDGKTANSLVREALTS